MIGFLILLLSVFLSVRGQLEKNVTVEQCQAEFNAIHACVKNKTLFHKIDDILLDDISNRLLSEEISRTLTSSSTAPQCPTAQAYLEFLKNQRWILDFYHETLEKCVGNEDVMAVGRYCSIINDDFKQCLLQDFLNRTKCSDKDFVDFLKFCEGFKKSREIEESIREDIKAHQYTEKALKD